MPLAGWVRDRLWRTNNWCAELALIRQSVGAERRSAATVDRIVDLAWASEHCDPDRGRALTLYLDAWRAGHTPAGARAKHLAGVLRAYMTLAEIALAEGDLLAAGIAFLDAGFPDLAVDPLQRFVDTRPLGASPSTENLRLESVTALLALARGQRQHAEREIADSLARAQTATGRAAASAYEHAARIARAAGFGERLATILSAATRACPDDDAIGALVEARLSETHNADELIAHYGARLERTTSRAVYVERARTAGVELIARNLQPGLGLRLLRMSLEHAYDALLPEITSHVAVWELLWTHAQVQRTTVELRALVDQGLLAPLPEDDAVYLARLGLEIAWRHASDTVGAKPYAMMVLDFVPDHPLAVAFVTEAAPELAAEATPPAAPDASSAAPTATPASSAVKPTSRIPVVEGQVKRAEAARSLPKAPHGVTGRMALLRPPAPRPASLDQRTSPVPTTQAPPPPLAPAFSPRAPRKVVPVDVVVELPGGGFFSTVLRDLSISGAFIVSKRQLEVGTIVALEMRIPTPGTLSQTSHRTNARIARRDDVGYGLAFVDTSPELVTAIRATIE